MAKCEFDLRWCVLLIASVVCGGWLGLQEEPPSSDPQGLYRAGGEVTRPEKISGPNPQHTERSRELGIEGTVIVEAVIDRRGDVIHVRVLKPLEESLDRATMDAIRKWKFKPATLEGVPVDVYYNLTVNFRSKSSLKGPTPARAAATVAHWQSQYDKLRKKMDARDWRAATALSKKLAVDMANQMPDGSGKPVLASIVANQTLAEAALRLDQDAIWHWQIAQNLDARTAGASAFATDAEVASLLDGNPLRRPGVAPDGKDLMEGPDGVTPPRPLAWPFPRAPRGLKQAWAKDVLEVELFVDAEGRVHAPVVLGGELPGKIYLGLEAMRGWRFAPATLDGEPVAVLQLVSIAEEPRTQ